MMKRNQIFGIMLVFSFLMPSGASAQSNQGMAVDAAKEVMDDLSGKNFDHLWDELASQWFKQSTGATRESFIANMTIMRFSLGTISNSDILDIKVQKAPPNSGFSGDVYVVTFHNKYSTGNAYEQIGVIEEDGEFKMSGFGGAPAP